MGRDAGLRGDVGGGIGASGETEEDIIPLVAEYVAEGRTVFIERCFCEE